MEVGEDICSRCGVLIEGEPVRVVVQSGPLHLAHPVINLCRACADSMSRWFARNRKSEGGEPAPRPAERSNTSSHSRRHRRGKAEKRKGLIRAAIGITVVFLGFAFLTLVTLSILKIGTTFLTP